MVTVGGVLAAKGAAGITTALVESVAWLGKPMKPIVAPHLTFREASALQSKLPCADALSRAVVQALGFDLAEEQIEAFQAYYRHYPSFAQIVS